MASRYWVTHPNLQPWTRVFISPLGAEFVASVVWWKTEKEGLTFDAHHLTGKTEDAAREAARAWIEKELGAREVRIIKMDGPDMPTPRLQE